MYWQMVPYELDLTFRGKLSYNLNNWVATFP